MAEDSILEEDTLSDIYSVLYLQREELVEVRDGLERDDPRGRHLSICITYLEDSILRLEQAIQPSL